MAQQLRMFDAVPADSIEGAFRAFHAKNPHVYELCRDHARKLARLGVQRIGFRHVWEVVRWEQIKRTNDPKSAYRMNDRYCSRYARLLMDNEPELAGLFETRRLRRP